MQSGKSWWIAFLLVAGIASADAPTPGAGGWLRWNLEDEPLSPWSPTYTLCHAVSVSWMAGGEGRRALWTVSLPPRMQQTDRGLCACRRVDDGGPCAAELGSYREQPRTTTPPFVVGIEREKDVLAVADRSGVLFLDVRTGKTLLDWEAPRGEGMPPLYVDHGRFALEGKDGCSGEVSHGQLFRRCGKQLLFFNGFSVALFRPGKPNVDAVASCGDQPGGGAQVKGRVPLGDRAFTIQGLIYMN